MRHGIEPSTEAGEISITTRRNNGMLMITISDDGPGLGESSTRNGVGIQNTRSRLEQLYGDDFEFTVANRSTRGVEVTLNIPYRTHGDS